MSAARRKRWVAWIPTMILALITVGVAVTAVVLLGNGLGAPVPKPTPGQVTDLNWSSFSEEGLDYIRQSRQVRVDLSDPPVSASAVGLEPDATLVLERVDSVDTMLDYDLIVSGAGEGPGGIRLTVSRIEIETAGDRILAIRGDVVDVLPFREALNRLEREADTYGWQYDRDAIFADVEDATRAGEPYELVFGPADRIGVNVTATASCGTNGFCTLAYEMSPRSD